MIISMTKKELGQKKIIAHSESGDFCSLGANIVANVSKQPPIVDISRIATERQSSIAYSTLPLGNLYVDDQLRGTILRSYPLAMDAKNIRLFPLPIRINYLRQLIRTVKELTDNCIYPLTIGNNQNIGSLSTNKIYTSVNPLNKESIHIFGLDGTGTKYTSNPDKGALTSCLHNLLILICNLLIDIDSYDLYQISDGGLAVMELDYITKRLRNLGMPSEMTEMVVTQKVDTYDQLCDIIHFAGREYQFKRN